MNEEVVIAQDVTTSPVVYEQEKAAIDTQVATAKAYPRNIQRVIDNSIATVSLDIETAQTCTYAVPRGGKQITGPSVHLARIISQFWGHLRTDTRVIAIDKTHVTAEAVCWDLETNVAMKVQVKRSIMGKHGRYNEDMITVTGNAACAVALRNAVFNVIPKGVIDRVYKAAQGVILGDVSDKNKFLARRKQVFDGIKDAFDVNEKEVLKAIGKATIAHVTPEDLVVLIGFAQSIKDGDTTVESVFRGAKEKENTDENFQKVFEKEEPKEPAQGSLL